MDESPVGVSSTVAQEHTIVGEDGVELKVGKPVYYTSHTKTEADKIYGKVGKNGNHRFFAYI